MKNKCKHAQLKRSHEFRYHDVIVMRNGKKYRLRHPVYIFLKKGNLYIYVTMTHSNKVDGFIVIRLRQNPNPKDKTPSYYVADIRTDKKDKFGRREDYWIIDPQDDTDIRKLFDETKKDDSVDRE